jgi:hypothetical protein
MKINPWIGVMLISVLAIVLALDNFGITTSANYEMNEPTPTLNVTPTLDPRQAAFEKLVQDNGGCELPCWWGLTLGQTKEEDWLTFLDELPFKVFREEAVSNGTLVPTGNNGYFSFPQSVSSQFIYYDFRDGMLSKVRLELDQPTIWLSHNVTAISLPGMLKRLNALHQTPEIYEYTGGVSSALDLPFLVVADDIGVMAEYEFDLSHTLPEPNNLHKWQYCLGLENIIRMSITVQDPDLTPMVIAKERQSMGGKEREWVRLEDLNIVPIDSAEFIQFFIDHPNDCYKPEVTKPESTPVS